MPRRKRGQAPELRPIAVNGPGPGHNEAALAHMPDDDKSRLFCNAIQALEHLIETKDSAVAAIRLHRKQMRADGFPRPEVDYALWVRKTETGEVRERIEMEGRIRRWLAHPIGFQASMFEAAPAHQPGAEASAMQ